MHEQIYGKCQVCGKVNYLHRKVYRVAIECDCHNNGHVVYIDHCPECVPKFPEAFTVTYERDRFLDLIKEDDDERN